MTRLTSITRQRAAARSAYGAPVRRAGERRWPIIGRPRRRTRLAVAGLLLVMSLLITVAQVNAMRWSAAQRSPFIQIITLKPGVQPAGLLTVAAPCTWGTYSIDLLMPDDASPLDYGIAFHEVRRSVRVTIRQAHQPTPLLTGPSTETLTQLEDQLDTRKGVELCDFRAESAGELAVTCQLDDALPWPAEVRIGISHSANEAKIHSSKQLTQAVQPYSFGASALLACCSLVLCWRPAGQ